MGTVLLVGLAPPVAGLIPLVMIAAKFADETRGGSGRRDRSAHVRGCRPDFGLYRGFY